MLPAMGTESKRISHTVLKSPEGFRAQIPGLDLATLIQMAAAHRERMVVRVISQGREGYLYFSEGQLVHATAETLTGEAAVTRMLSWTAGDFSVCHRLWPARTTISVSTEALLIRAAQQRDEAAARAGREATGVRNATARQASASLTLAPVPAPDARATSTASPGQETPPLASVRIDMNGEVVSQQGDLDTLAPLVAYVTRLGALLGFHLGLEPFDALHAELGERRLVVFADGAEMVGLMLTAGPAAQELRHQLGV